MLPRSGAMLHARCPRTSGAGRFGAPVLNGRNAMRSGQAGRPIVATAGEPAGPRSYAGYGAAPATLAFGSLTRPYDFLQRTGL